MKICIVLSTRPEIIKLSSLIDILKKNEEDFYLINTNQHSINKMSKIFFDFFNIKGKIFNIKPSRKTQYSFLSDSVKLIGKNLLLNKPNYLIVQGDTNTSLAGCLAASLINRNLSNKSKINIAHIESGLRSFDDTMPEEINRKLIDKMSNFLFIPTKFDFNNLKRENCLKDKKYYIVGNTISDVLKKYLPLTSNSKILKKLNINKKNYFLITMHRPESVDILKNLKKLNKILDEVIKRFDIPVIFPIHPRTKNMFEKFKLKLNKKVLIIDPLQYLDFLELMKNSKLLLTDSGGLQEEAAIIGVPCITLRTTTERQISVIKKVNYIAGYDKSSVIKGINFFNKKKIKSIKDFGNGKVSDKIYKFLKRNYK